MKLYKFRSFENLEFVLDIILNERLYCAHFSGLNDPFEGIYLAVSHYPPVFLQRLGTQRIDRKSVCELSEVYETSLFNRICSLSASIEDTRLWAHYADGHRGIAIEIDFSGNEDDLKLVRYPPKLKRYSNTILGTPFPDEILSQKTPHWEHEKEFRIMQSEPYYPVSGRISGIYLGLRISDQRMTLW